ncbi:MAG: hypothetical protein ACM3NV_09935, partial [Syntrophothermus sp.]
GPPGAYNLAGPGQIHIADIARSIGWRSVRVPAPIAGAGTTAASRLSFVVPELEWAVALRTPVLMDTAKARRELAWAPRFDAGETLRLTAAAAREAGLLA